MKFINLLKVVVGVLLPMTTFCVGSNAADLTPDSVYLFSYSKPDGKSGLRFAWSEDGKTWNSICDSKSNSRSGYNFVSSDFGPWGSHKTMFDPMLYKTSDGWMAVWYVSDKRETMAAACSSDLINWKPQRYAAAKDSCGLGFCGLGRGVKTSADINGKSYSGRYLKVSRTLIDRLQSYVDKRGEDSRQDSELMKDDVLRFAQLNPINVKVSVNKDKNPVRISNNLIGIFFEDINYAADGGLYAELVQNRDFEYDYNENHKRGWGPHYAWKLHDGHGNIVRMEFDTITPVHTNNKTYLKVHAKGNERVLENTGFDGISYRKGENYLFSMFARNSSKKVKTKFDILLVSAEGNIVGKGNVEVKGNDWQKISTEIIADRDATAGTLQIVIPWSAVCDLDMISLFPENTYKGRRNGLRKDLAETLEALHPKFVRFPGGCVAHGDGIDNIYDWKGSIGPLESRKPLRNIWNYHQSRGLGYHEYFLMCEDMGAEPLPVLAAGVPCQNSGRPYSGSHDEITSLGQQCGIPMEEMDDYVQHILDLIEYANGDADTEWGRKRAQAGHPEPFNLKYLGIGNEDMITDVFEERFKYIFDILKEKHPEITVIGTVGPFFEGSDYEEGWKFAKKEGVPMVDEHYYVSPGWYLNHRDFYDSYDRNGPKVYLGEYASHLPDRKNTLETALTVALYLTDVERNADVVEMTSYAPLLAKKKHENWRPDLIFFTNDSIMLTPDYYVQKMYGQNPGTQYVPMEVEISDSNIEIAKRLGHSLVCDDASGDLIVKIANLLPQPVSWEENLSDMGVMDTKAYMEVLKGNPDDECTKPHVESVFVKGGKLNIEIAPYSFNVIRIHHNGL